MVFFPLARHSDLMAEVERYANHKLPRFLDEVIHCSGPVLVHSRPWWISAGLCLMVPSVSSSGANSPNEIVIKAMIKGLCSRPVIQYLARKPPQSLEKLLHKMDEYIRVDDDFYQRREEAQRYAEMTRGSGGRFHPKHVKSIHNPN
jgi:hypothetical protein